MTKVSMDLVKQLRDQTQIGMMDCKKALEEAGGDFEKALELLRKKGASVAAKRADNETNNGRVEGFISADHKLGALVEVACETDFSANTETMKNFVQSAASLVAHNNPADVTVLMGLKQTNSPLSLQESLDEVIAKICEKIKVSRFARFVVAQHGVINMYIHPGSTVGVMIELATDKDASAHQDILLALAKDLCMQAAVTKPLCVQPSELDQTIVEKERTLAREQLQDSKKPESIVEKIIDGKMNKFYEEVCLLNQVFIKNDKVTVKAHLEDVSKKTGTQISVVQFKRFAIGR